MNFKYVSRQFTLINASKAAMIALEHFTTTTIGNVAFQVLLQRKPLIAKITAIVPFVTVHADHVFFQDVVCKELFRAKWAFHISYAFVPPAVSA